MTTPLADLRKQLNLSKVDLARKAGVGIHSVQHLERGIVKKYHPRTVRKIAEALGVQPGEITEVARLNPVGDNPSKGPRPLREIRQLAYLSIIDLAGISGVSFAIIDAIELHKIEAPLWAVDLLVNALDVSPADILEFAFA